MDQLLKRLAMVITAHNRHAEVSDVLIISDDCEFDFREKCM